MYKKDLDGLIASSNLPKSILLYGESFFTNYYTLRILPIFGEKDNILSFYYDEYHFESARNFIAQPSLFGDVNILYIRADKKIPKKELDKLVELCQKNQNSYFLLHFTGTDQVGKDLAKSFTKKKKSDFVRFFKPNISQALVLLKEEAQKHNLQIENFALQHLFVLQNEDLSLCINELEKLSILNKPISVDDIDTHVYGMGALSLDDFITKLLQKEDIRDSLYTLLESGSSDEIRIINTISNYITQLMLFHMYIKVHGRYDAIAILGYPLPPQLLKSRASQSIKIKIETFQKLLKHLIDSEHTLKYSQNIDKNSYLISTLIKLQTYL